MCEALPWAAIEQAECSDPDIGQVSQGRTCIKPDERMPLLRGAWGPAITEHDIDWIAGAGFDPIRLPVRFGSHWSGRIWPGFLTRVEQVILQAKQRGMTVILDLHHLDELMTDPDTYAPVFVSIWAELAERFEGYDERLIFERLNEPRDAATTARAMEL